MELPLRIADERCRAAVDRIRALVAEEGGRALLVGGCVRDAVLGRPVRDVDVEVFGVDGDRLEARLAEVFGCRRVGTAYPVLVLDGLPIDVSLPERPDLGFAAAAARRDFTLNALGWDPERGELLDPHGGRSDLEARVLRHTSARFVEDPLRVLRGMQLCARFDLEAAPETVAICRTLTPEGIPPERIFAEWRKLLIEGERISRGLAFLQACDWLPHFPELAELVGCPQDPEWHPEGDVWIHTLYCLDAFAQARTGDEREDLLVGLAVLCHDFGKPPTTVTEADGRITSKRHDRVGETLVRRFLERMTRETELLREVPRLVAAHLAPSQLHRDRAGDTAIRRLAGRVGSIERLLRVAAADHAGRPPKPALPFEAGDWLRERARALAISDRSPEPLLKGRHLVALALEPGPAFGELLDACFEAQLRGDVTTLDEAIEFARRRSPRSG
jgi:tRNA nucleotidyltransferase (CCA-adding enzyme)